MLTFTYRWLQHGIFCIPQRTSRSWRKRRVLYSWRRARDHQRREAGQVLHSETHHRLECSRSWYEYSRPTSLVIILIYGFPDAVTDLKPYFEALLDSARTVPTLSITINLYFTSVSRGLIIRPMSLFPTAALLNYAPPSSPISAASSQATLAGDDDPEKSIRSSLPFLEDDPKFKSKPRSFIDTAIRSSWRKSSYPVAPPSSPDDPFSDAARAKNVVEVKGGRPDFPLILKEVCAMAKKFGPRVGNTIDHGVAVGACGPAGMVRGLQKQCGALEDVEFHAE